MQTYISDIIPKLQRFSSKLDNLTMFINKHWVVIDELENSKTVYIFRINNELLISKNGKVEKAKWEYLGQNSLIIEQMEEITLFKHGFLDPHILALKIDSKEEYVFLINEIKYSEELNSLNKISKFLKNTYLDSGLDRPKPKKSEVLINSYYNKVVIKLEYRKYNSQMGIIEIEHYAHFSPSKGDNVKMNNDTAPDGIYKIGFWNYVHVKQGKVTKVSMFSS